MTINPKYVAAARELRDRFLEELAERPGLLDGQASGGKYDVSRALMLEGGFAADQSFTAESAEVAEGMRLLDAA